MLPAICATVQGYTPSRVRIATHSTAQMVAAINEDEAVPIALMINELLMNAVKHTPPAADEQTVLVHLDDAEDRVRLTITNPGRLPPGFDGERSALSGSGLRIVRSLLPERGARLDIANTAQGVRVTLELWAPVITRDVPSQEAVPDESTDAALNAMKEPHG